MTDTTHTQPGAPPTGRRRATKAVAVVMAVVVVVSLVALGVGALSGSSSDSTPASGETASLNDGAAVQSDAADARSASALTSEGGAGSTGQPAGVTLADRSVIRTGAMSLATDDVEAARRELLAVTDQLGGYVADEQSRADRDGRLRSADLTLQVPTGDLDTAMERIGAAGTVISRSQSARDVTSDVVDVDSRVASARASLQRVRLLLNRATSLGDVINLEQVLSSRQAELEALLAQQESLSARTSLALLRVDVSLPALAPPPDKPQEASGFLAGLARGWHALGAGYLALATVVGAALPTAVVLALLALAGRFAVRRIRSSRTAAPSVRTEPGPG